MTNQGCNHCSHQKQKAWCKQVNSSNLGMTMALLISSTGGAGIAAAPFAQLEQGGTSQPAATRRGWSVAYELLTLEWYGVFMLRWWRAFLLPITYAGRDLFRVGSLKKFGNGSAWPPLIHLGLGTCSVGHNR